ncbi:MAG: hypothetical protein WCR12_07335 [Dysgonamonadaceae bacterium]
MKKKTLILLLTVFYATGAFAQQPFRIMFYNVENLFDVRDDSLKNDDDFLPGGNMNWNNWKYWEKLKNITRVVTSIGKMYSPALVGLCEIESDSTIYDLTKRSPLRAQRYSYITTNSPDERGIDVALLYQRHQFKLLEKHEYQIQFENKKASPTRNILHTVGRLINSDTLDVFICHFPSRRDGKRESEHLRIDAAKLLKSKTDSLFATRITSNIVIMGDFNDHPNDKSLTKILQAKSVKDDLYTTSLYNMFYHKMKTPDFGSYKYQGRWEVLDQFIVSGTLLLDSAKTQISNNEAQVYQADFLLLDDDKNGGSKPFRTNLGPRYIGGFSDHLPIYLDLEL